MNNQRGDCGRCQYFQRNGIHWLPLDAGFHYGRTKVNVRNNRVVPAVAWIE